MQSPRNGLTHAIALASLLLCMNARADWAQSTDPLVVKPYPSNNQVAAQNPPGFTWARHPAAPSSYEIEITPAGGGPTTAVVDRNWHLPTKALPVGNYTWRVRPANSLDWSTARPFSITGNSVVFEVPDNATLRARIIAKPRPRALPVSFTPYVAWSAAKKADLDPYASRMANEVRLQIGAIPELSDARWPLPISSPLTAAAAAQQLDVMQRMDESGRQLEAAALMWRLKADPVFLNEALKRGDQLAGLNPAGPTSFANADQGARQIALSLTRAIDLLGTDLDGGRRIKWLDIVRTRTNEMYADLANRSWPLDQYPLDSHANRSMVFLMLVSSLALGDIPDAQKWFDFSFRFYANSPSPWSGPEGGYANGTAYAEYDTHIGLFDALSQAGGVNFYAQPWARGFFEFAAQFVPPGSTVHAFGDASETKPDARVWYTLASRMVSPRAAWYFASLGANGAYQDAFLALQAPYPLPVSDTTAKIPPSSSSYFPSIGWVSMHSDIASSARSSLYFKSSPYGSYNHSHGDQNGLLLSAGGQPLLVKAGWYDWYGSPLWNDWYRQTRSQNAITYDGGKGQDVSGYRETMQHNGKITAFAAQPGYDYTEGDATAAYAGALTMAKRQVWHLRYANNAILVRDKLSSIVARTYEFNLHAPVAMTVESPSSVRIALNGQSVCVRSLYPDAAFAKWTGPAPRSGVVEDHGAFYLKGAANATAEFLVLLDVGCRRPYVTVVGRSLVTVGAQTVTLN
jgi:hypothetical protein